MSEYDSPHHTYTVAVFMGLSGFGTDVDIWSNVKKFIEKNCTEY